MNSMCPMLDSACENDGGSASDGGPASDGGSPSACVANGGYCEMVFATADGFYGCKPGYEPAPDSCGPGGGDCCALACPSGTHRCCTSSGFQCTFAGSMCPMLDSACEGGSGGTPCGASADGATCQAGLVCCNMSGIAFDYRCATPVDGGINGCPLVF
jgi:hypothetical protein